MLSKMGIADMEMWGANAMLTFIFREKEWAFYFEAILVYKLISSPSFYLKMSMLFWDDLCVHIVTIKQLPINQSFVSNSSSAVDDITRELHDNTRKIRRYCIPRAHHMI